jgi:hypothetical protein
LVMFLKYWNKLCVKKSEKLKLKYDAKNVLE